MKCLLCGKKAKEIKVHGVYECPKCRSIFGNCYLGDSYLLVKPFLEAPTEGVEERYFDLTCLGSEGITRRHGWFNPQTKNITQIG